MQLSPPLRYPPEVVANARALVANPGRFADLSAEDFADVAETAWAILSQDHAARHMATRTPHAAGQGTLRPIPLAVFQAGPARLRTRPLPGAPTGTSTGTPGDAA